ncbi:hypothetical protein HY024_01050 [Candidatus Curtissbacteria bacterium]|nr:hypothetical protein [Candidatus Curtissbacteria bacterium]
MKKFALRRPVYLFLVVLLTLSAFLTLPARADAGLLSSTSVQLSDSRPSQATTTYTATYTFSSTSAIKCIDLIFSDTTAHITLTANPATTAPAGMTTTSAVKTSVTGGGLTDGNWTLYNSTNGILQYEYATGATPTATSVTITTNTMTNPSASSFYFQIATYSTLSTHTCSGLVDNSNVGALVTTAGVLTSVTVDPTLSFSVANYGSAVNGSGDSSPVTTTSATIPLGTVAAGSTAWGSQTLTVSTNAAHGYNLYARYTAQMTDAASDTLRDQACVSSDCSTAANAQTFDGSSTQSSLAYTADGNSVTFGSNKWLGFTTSNVKVANRTAAINADPTHVEVKVEISNVQPPGTYSTTLTYTADPTY